jgi:hypothetical protein
MVEEDSDEDTVTDASTNTGTEESYEAPAAGVESTASAGLEELRLGQAGRDTDERMNGGDGGAAVDSNKAQE